MAKINISSVKAGSTDYTLLIFLTETQKINGEDAQVPIGEGTVQFSRDTEAADIKAKIVDTAQRIMKAHKDAQDKHHDLDQMDFPPIE